MKSIAHTKNSQGKRQDLDEHLRNVANDTSRYCASFGAAQFGYQAGILHDIGKYDPAFQQYLLNAEKNPKSYSRGPDHKGAGTVLAERFERKGSLASIIFGHHGGIPSNTTLYTKIQEHKKRKPVEDAITTAQRLMPELLVSPGKIFPAYIRTVFDLEFFTRMTFSSLVDADFLDTEQHFNMGKRPERKNGWTIPELWKTFETAYTHKFAGAERNALNTIRAEVYQSCLKAASLPPGFFRLTVPTGGGKTLSSLGFALKHAKEHDLERVIYAIPYTSIIDQTAQVFREIFSDEMAFIEHHSNISLPDSENTISTEIHRRLASENWDAPLIATTTVQLFESLMGHSTSKCRKLHNIAKSVIVLDEVQMLPVHFLTPILDTLRQLVANYGVSVVLCTATQPDFEPRRDFEGLPDIREIITEPERYFAQLKRVEYQLPQAGETWTWEQVAARVEDERQILVIVNSRRDATELMNLLTYDDVDDPSLFHLSTRLCSAHRKAVLEEVRRRLQDGEPCRLISTQVIEAGVDVDFPLVMRAIGPLDSIVQAAGRANREGKMTSGTVIVFAPENGHAPKGSYLVGTDIAKRLLKDGGADLHDPTLYQHYFRDYYDYPYRDYYGIQELRKSFNYPEVAQKFHMIEDDSTSVIVKYQPASETVEKLLDTVRNSTHLRRKDLRALQPYTVNLLKHEFEKAKQSGLVLEVIPGLWEWRGKYDSSRDGQHGQGIILDSALSAEINIW